MIKIEEIKRTEIKEIDLEVQEGENLGHLHQGGDHPHREGGLQVGEREKEAPLILHLHGTKQKALVLLLLLHLHLHLQFLTRESWKFKNLSHL